MTKTPPSRVASIDTAELFAQFGRDGEDELIAIRKIIEQDAKFEPKSPRSWGIQQAAEMIGRSQPWLRENDPEVPRNERGHGRWTLERINALRDAANTRYVRPKNSEPMIIPLVNFKGGVGKTTECAHLAQKAAIDGLRVLAVDLDPQATLTFLLGGLIPEVDLEESDLINDCLLEHPDQLAQIIRPTYFHGVDLVPSSLQLQDLDLSLPNPQLNNARQLGSPARRLEQALSHVKDRYDLILIDCPPNMGSITANALAAATGLIIPLPPAAPDRASFVMFSQSLSLFYTHLDKQLKYVGILISKHEGTQTHAFNEGRIRALYGRHVLANALHDSTEIDKAAGYMRTVYELERPLNSRETYQRALDGLNAVNDEILNDLRKIWESEA